MSKDVVYKMLYSIYQQYLIFLQQCFNINIYICL